MKNKYPKKFLTGLYQKMLEIRLFEESLVEPILKGEIKTPCHLYTGQEAVAVGVCASLKRTDYVFGNHRSHGHYLAKGGNLNALMAEIFGKETGCSRGRGGSMHIIDTSAGFLGSAPIVAGTISLAAGQALASKIKKEKRVTVSFFGDGATNEGVFYESLNLASLYKLPIIFICENNLYSTHMPIRECSANTKIYQIAKAFKMPSFKIDGNNVLEVFETVKKVVDRARQNKGPAFIECLTYRLRGHVGPDDNVQGLHTDIRSKKEVETWRKKDPIKKFEELFIENGVINKKNLEEIYQKTNQKIKEAHKFAQKSAFPKKSELLKYVFKK